jgi:hypothetical protein
LIIEAIRYLLAFVFLSSGSWKLFHYNEYINSILSYKTLSVFGPRFSVSLILVELWIGIGYLVNSTALQAGWVGTIFLMLFSVLVFFEHLAGSTTDCGCGVALLSQRIGIQKLIENVILLGLSVLLLISLYREKAKRKEVKLYG